MGGSSIVNAFVDPIGRGISAVTGDDVNLNPLTIGKKELYDKPKQALKDAEAEANRQQQEYDKSLKLFEKDSNENNRKQRDLALANLERAKSRLRQYRGSGNKGGTLLTSPLGVVNDAISNTKTLLGL